MTTHAETTLQKLQKAKEEKNKTQQAKDNTQERKDSLKITQNSLLGQLSSLNDDLEQIGNKLQGLEQNITDKEAQISRTQDELAEAVRIQDEQYAAMKIRIKYMYERGNDNYLELLFTAGSFSDFLSKSEYVERLHSYDRRMLEQYQEARRQVEETQSRLEEELASLEDLHEQTQEEQGKASEKVKQTADSVADYANQIQDAEATIDQLEDMISQQENDIAALQKQYEANKAEIDKMMAQVQSEINDIYASYESQGEYTGGVMTWPVPGYTGITSYYGWRFNNTDFHTGIDISGSNIYGRNIVAAADGVVIKAQETYVQGVGYGRYLIIDHGGNISTLYGHTSQLLVSEGDHVTRGQAIAKVGSTGWSTGPHLHFEVRESGTAVNPLSGYLKP